MSSSAAAESVTNDGGHFGATGGSSTNHQHPNALAGLDQFNRDRSDSQKSIPSIMVSPSSPTQPETASLAAQPNSKRAARDNSTTSAKSAPRINTNLNQTSTPQEAPSSPSSPVIEHKPTPTTTTNTSAADSAPAAANSSFSLSSFIDALPSLPNLPANLNLSSFIPKFTSTPTLQLVGSSHESGPASSGRQREDSGTIRIGEKEIREGENSIEDPNGSGWGMNLDINQATANGETFDEDFPAPAHDSPRKPNFPALGRRQSAAFVRASETGKVNPLTLHLVARKESEVEALRIVREREERDKKYNQQEIQPGGYRPNTLVRKQSWSQMGRSESPAPAVKGKLGAQTGLNQVHEEENSSQTTSTSHDRAQSESTTPKSTSQTATRTDSLDEGVRGASLDETNEKFATTPKKKSFFSRFGARNRTASTSTTHSINSSAPNSPADLQIAAHPAIERSSTSRSLVAPEKIRFAKTKTHRKSHKDFGKLFLAQELFLNSPNTAAADTGGVIFQRTFTQSSDKDRTARETSPEGGDEPPPTPGTSSTSAGKKKAAVWCTKFSEDGRFLAAGGKDGIVRVWKVLENFEDRQQTMFSHVTQPQQLPTSPTRSSTLPPTPTTPNTPSSSKKKASAPRVPVNVMPVFGSTPWREFVGHEADVLDLSWSKNNFLLSSSMDKTVRLWHVSRDECLCAFQHLDFVTSIAFHPKDDRFFLSGSLDCKLRLWNIPEKRVHIYTEIPELITAVSFTRDGKLALAGTFTGICMMFEVETFRYHTHFAAKSTRGKNSKGRKVASMTPFPLESAGGERVLVTSNDSRVRLFHVIDKTIEEKYSGHENTSSQIRASFSDDGRFIISGSEDRNVYIWDSGLTSHDSKSFTLLPKKKEGPGYETFTSSAHIVTCASFVPLAAREILAESGDPIFSDPSASHHNLIPLQTTISGASLVTQTTRLTGHMSAAENAMIVCADDETGVISVYRNSEAPVELSKKAKRSSRVSASGP